MNIAVSKETFMEKRAYYGIHIATKTGVDKRIQYLTGKPIIFSKNQDSATVHFKIS